MNLVRIAIVLFGLAALFAVAASPATSQEAAPLPPLNAQFQAARVSFKPVDDAQLAAALQDLQARMADLERFVQPRTENGRRWLSYLKWASLKQELSKSDGGVVDLSPLAETHQQLNRNETGLEMPQFRRLSNALRKYIDLAVFARVEDPAAAYQRQLGELAADLERRRGQRGATGDRALVDYNIERRLDLIAGIGQAPNLVNAIRREFTSPNAFLNVSVGLVRAAAEEPIDRRDPIVDNILGTSIQGDGHTTGFVIVRALPSEERATIELRTKGHVESQNTGRNGPAVIRSTGHTDFTATKVIQLSDADFRSAPAQVEATSRSDIHSIGKAGGGIGSRLVSSQGWSRARQTQPRVNAIAADHAEERIARRIDDEVAKKLRDARKRYEDEYRLPLARRGELPEYIRFSSSADSLSIVATQANRAQLAAGSAPPELPAEQDLVLRLHDSAVNNYAAAVLGGATASETDPGQERAEFDVQLPKWMRDAWQKKRTEGDTSTPSADPFKPWSLTFRPTRPLTVVFADGKISLTIHLARLTSGDEVFEGWDVTGTFIPQLEEGGVTLRREGDLVVLPTGFDTQSGEQLDSRRVGIRSNLSKVLNERSAQGRGFPSEIKFAQLSPTGALEKVGPLTAQVLDVRNGWLTLAWRRQEGSARIVAGR